MPLEGITVRHGRQTTRLADLHYYIAHTLGGSAGARMTVRLCCPISADTLVRRLLSRVQNTTKGTALTRVVGVDGLRHHHPQEPGLGIPGGGDSAGDAALRHAGAEPALHRRHTGAEARRARGPEEGACYRRAQSGWQATVVEAQGVACG